MTSRKRSTVFWDLIGPDEIGTAFDRLADRGRRFLADEGIAADKISFERAIDFRYYGQDMC